MRSPWLGFLGRRLASYGFALWGILTLVFFLSKAIGGDAVRASSGITVSAEFIAQRRAELGLDDPVFVQYLHYLQGVVRLDFGRSVAENVPVTSVIAVRLPYTLQLGVDAFLLAVLVAIPCGMAVAALTQYSRRRRTDAGFNAVTGLLSSVPDYLIAVGLVLVFSVWFRLLPAAGGDGAKAIILPVLTIASGPAAVLARLVKTETARVLAEDYIATARANHLPAIVLFTRHVLPNVLTATLTYGGLLLASLLSGTIITETIFALPGMGSLLTSSLQVYDYTMVVGVALIVAALALLVNFLVDLLLALTDRRSLIIAS
jgi:peptide/nickel transport system permease protein